jgi:mitogen-activated protein kinase kinase kinase
MSVEQPQRGVRFRMERPPIDQVLAFNTVPEAAEHPAPVTNDSGESESSDDSQVALGNAEGYDEEGDGDIQFTPGSTRELQFTPVSTRDNLTPISVSPYNSWNSNSQPRPRGGSGGVLGANAMYDVPAEHATNGVSPRPQRPSGPARTPSSTYAPPRRPPQYISIHANRNRSSSASRSRRDPNAQYRAQEKAYVQRLRQDPSPEYFGDFPTPSLSYGTESENEDESPSSDARFEDDPYDQETLLYYGNDDMNPSPEELKIPANRERLEWHSMLASVLTGDVVKQEKKRLIRGSEQKEELSLRAEVWIGVRSKVCGRSPAAQRRIIEEARASLDPIIESIIDFEIKGEKEVGKSPVEQVKDIVNKIERCENLYPTRLALEIAKPRAASSAFKTSCDAVIAWNNTTELINTELAILQGWVGNEELDFTRAKTRSPSGSGLSDESSFLDRILKEDGLKSLVGDRSMLLGVGKVIDKAKETLIENAERFSNRHLPPYIEELLTLINFPTRLIEEVIRMRLRYAKKMRDPTQQGSMMADQTISQFQALLQLAVQVKKEYIRISRREPGWDLPPCIDENFDQVVLDALKFYFKMLNWKLSGNKNTFKEAEILEQEWEFSNSIGRFIEGGDVEVAEQFR